MTKQYVTIINDDTGKTYIRVLDESVLDDIERFVERFSELHGISLGSTTWAASASAPEVDTTNIITD